MDELEATCPSMAAFDIPTRPISSSNGARVPNLCRIHAALITARYASD